jgi:hypothetical protein
MYVFELRHACDMGLNIMVFIAQVFHAELSKRYRNQPGFIFVKSRRYDVEYDSRTMQPEDWKTVKPFTVLLVDFVIIQQQNRKMKCPWCKTENLIPSGLEQSLNIQWYVTIKAS